MIYYLIADYAATSWGNGMIYEHVRMLREAGYDACALHHQAPFRPLWLDLNVPIRYVDEEGYLFLTDRKSHMIISGGVNIYPQEIENLLITHPKVLDVAVIGVPDADLGEQVKAIVQTDDPSLWGPDLAAELLWFCSVHLARYKCPRSVDFIDELPRLPTGKLYKRLLKDRYWGDRGTRV
jgi:long-chain acyl-CoA synthetase